ncbi:MAG: GntR family transcriptional regulator [Bdellovibrionales bacterium]|nr:GntR family transcriptional regulator [Bdellovibrionales bacterium]
MGGHQTLRERISDALRESIIKGELAPGERLQEVEIAAAYQTSRTPVREAFRQLESEGFLVIRPRRGAVVTPITVKDIREFYEVKSVLESFAAEKAVDKITDEQIDRMEELNRELKRRHQNGDITGMVPVHNEFHEIFVNACGNERLAQLIRNLVNQFQRYRIALSHTEAIDESIRVHEQIVDAFRMRDSRKVTELVGMNSSQGGENLINSISCLN